MVWWCRQEACYLNGAGESEARRGKGRRGEARGGKARVGTSDGLEVERGSENKNGAEKRRCFESFRKQNESTNARGLCEAQRFSNRDGRGMRHATTRVI